MTRSFWSIGCVLALAACNGLLGNDGVSLGDAQPEPGDDGAAGNEEGGADGTVAESGSSSGSSGSEGGGSSGAIEAGSSSGTDGASSKTDGSSSGGADAGAGCVIGGAHYAPGASDPSNACLVCDPTASSSSWSDAPAGTSCGTGTCEMGECAVTLASGLSLPYAIALDSQYVYFSQDNGGAGSLAAVPIGGGGVATIASGLPEPSSIEVVGPTLYWINGGTGSLNSIPIGGGMTSTLYSTTSLISELATDQKNIYWTLQDTQTPSAGMIMKVSLSGGVVSTIATGQTYPEAVTTSGGNFFWTETSGNVVELTSGGTLSTLASSQFGYAIAVDDVNVYWSDGVSNVLQVPIGGGSTTTLVSNLTNPGGLVLDDGNLYFTSRGTVGKVIVSTGQVVDLMEGTDTPSLAPQDIAVDATSVYWASPDMGLLVKLTPK
jgi:hypothetical protein